MIFITNNKSAKTEVSIRFPDWKAKAVTFSYDDGVLEDVKLVELFNQYGVKGTFNINSGSMGARKLGIFHARLDSDYEFEDSDRWGVIENLLKKFILKKWVRNTLLKPDKQ